HYRSQRTTADCVTGARKTVSGDLFLMSVRKVGFTDVSQTESSIKPKSQDVFYLTHLGSLSSHGQPFLNAVALS
ncbi:hypothetical protein, partial [Idiomarina aquatica]